MTRFLVAAITLLVSSCATYHSFIPSGGVDKFYQVNGHRVHMMIEGEGPVVILSGGGGVNDPYVGFSKLISGLKNRKAKVALYERPGYGMSEGTNIPRTIDTVVHELDQLFTMAELKGPFVLVGHSMASLELLHYAQTFPTKVKAIVLLEGAPPKFYLTMKMPSDFEQSVSTFLFGLAKGNSLEIKSLVENANRVLQKGPLGEIPLLYFYAGANGISGWAEAQKEFSELSNKSEPIFIKDANHFIYEENTDEILRKIGELL